MANWSPGEILSFDGTIDKAGERHTALGLELSEQDIVSLSAALVRYYKRHTRMLEKECSELQEKVSQLEDAFGKIYSLISHHLDRAPSDNEMYSAINEAADHFRMMSYREEPFKSGFDWLNWKTL